MCLEISQRVIAQRQIGVTHISPSERWSFTRVPTTGTCALFASQQRTSNVVALCAAPKATTDCEPKVAGAFVNKTPQERTALLAFELLTNSVTPLLVAR